MAVKYGAYKTTIAYIPKRKIQRAIMKQNPFQRASQVAHIYMHTAASGITTKQMDVAESRAAEYLLWATPETTLRKSRTLSNEPIGQNNPVEQDDTGIS